MRMEGGVIGQETTKPVAHRPILERLAANAFPFAALAFAWGVWMLQQQVRLPRWTYWQAGSDGALLGWLDAVLPAPTFLVGLGGALWLAGRRWRVAGLLGACLCGFGWAAWQAETRLADALPAAWEGRDIVVDGVVSALPQSFAHGERFDFTVDSATAPVPSRISLTWYADAPAGDRATQTARPPLRAGERRQFTVRLKRPHGDMNPHGFDHEAWLFERNLRATGYVRSAAAVSQPPIADTRPASRLHRLRDDLRTRMQVALAGRPHAGVLIALALGDQQAIGRPLWRVFAATGTTHLMSISGLHVTLFGALAAWLTNRLWRRSPRLPLCWPAQKAAAVAGLVGALLYALLAGFGVPAQRTLYMLAAFVLALLSGRAASLWQALGAGLIAVLLVDPWAVLAAGFWLSFGAVALLFLIARDSGKAGWLGQWVRVQGVLAIGLAPLLLALFQQLSLVSPLANLVAVPLIGGLVTPLLLLGQLPGMSFLWILADLLLTPLMAGLDGLARLPFAVWQQAAPPAWAPPLAFAGVVGGLLGFAHWPANGLRRWGSVALCLLCTLPLFVLPPPRPAAGEVRLTLLDVGQGQAVHLQTASHDLLYDSGPAWDDGDAGERILLPYLRAAGVRRLDALAVSHADRDHAGGTASLLAGIEVAALWSSAEKSALVGRQEGDTPAEAGAPPLQRCQDGDSWRWDDVQFRFLHPTAADLAGKQPRNALSCVLLVESPHGRILLPGDLDGEAERTLLARHGADVHADILVAAHHGAKNTAAPAFVAAVAARTVLFSVGYRNRFGHPHAQTLERFATQGARLYRSDYAGAVRLLLGAQATPVERSRAKDRRYWHTDEGA